MALLLFFVIAAQSGAQVRTLDHAHQVTADATDDGGGQGGEDAAIDQSGEDRKGPGLRRHDRIAKRKEQGAAHTDGGPDHSDAKEQAGPDLGQMFELSDFIRRRARIQPPGERAQAVNVQAKGDAERQDRQPQVAPGPLAHGLQHRRVDHGYRNDVQRNQQVDADQARHQAEHHAQEHAGQKTAAVLLRHGRLFDRPAGLAGGVQNQFGFLKKAVRPIIFALVGADLEQALLLVHQFPVHLPHDFLAARAGLGADAIVTDHGNILDTEITGVEFPCLALAQQAFFIGPDQEVAEGGLVVLFGIAFGNHKQALEKLIELLLATGRQVEAGSADGALQVGALRQAAGGGSRRTGITPGE